MSDAKFNLPNGLNFRSECGIAGAALALALREVVGFLQRQEPFESLRLHHDWWERDRLHFDRGSLDYAKLFEIIRSPRDLLRAMPGDEDVFIGVAPASGQWYLRFYLAWDDDGFKQMGQFDVTVPSPLAASFRKEVVKELKIPLTEEDADKYYAAIRL